MFGVPRPEPTWELIYKRNSIERMKRDKFPPEIALELPDLIARGYEAVPEEDIVRLSWLGLTHDKPKVGTFMVRIKVPGGRITAPQLRAVGGIAETWGRDYAELTTRQGVQLHWVRLDQVPDVLEAVRATGLSTMGSEGDTVRNITSCPAAGIAKDEWFDVTPVIRAAEAFFSEDPDYANLPRKLKYTISACPYQCNAPEIHDVALVGVLHEGRPGFALRVGGGLSSTPRLSRDIGVFVPAGAAVEVLQAVTDVWRTDPRYRLSRAKARIKFMVDDHGPEGVRRRLEERLGRRLEDHAAPEPAGEHHHLGIHPQKQDGFSYVGFSVPLGRVSGGQLRRLADAVEEAGADVRFTRLQNFVVGNVADERLEALVRRVAEVGFPLAGSPLHGTSIACTSHGFCNYSVAETKLKLGEILDELDRRYGEAASGLKVFMDGCPHACAHHWVGDIGLQGTTARTESGRKLEAYDVALRGGLGPAAAIGKPVLRRVPEAEITGVVARLVGAWLETRRLRSTTDSFAEFVAAHTDEELRRIAQADHTAADALPERPVLRVSGPLLAFTGGLDRIEARATTVGELIHAATRPYGALRAHLLDERGQLNEHINFFLNEEDVRGLQGLDTPVRPGDELTVLPALAGG